MALKKQGTHHVILAYCSCEWLYWRGATVFTGWELCGSVWASVF